MNQTSTAFAGFETDVGNPNFTNPKNPDSLLAVEFYMGNPIDKWESDQKSYAEGRKVKVYKHLDDKGEPMDVPYVRISSPGQDSLNMIDEQVREDHKRRFPQQWLRFQMQEGMIEDTVIGGWRLEDWEHLNEDQIRELNHMRFYTVEQIAGANDAQIQGMGIMGPGLRVEAKKAMQNSVDNRIKAVEESKDNEIKALREQMAAQAEDMVAMKDMLENLGKAEKKGK